MSRAVPVVLAMLLTASLVGGATASGTGARPTKGYVRLENVLTADRIGVRHPGNISWDSAARALVVADRRTGVARLVKAQGHVIGSASGKVADADLSATDAATGHRYTLRPERNEILERDAAGTLLSVRDVSSLQLRGADALTVAPTSDTTDAADAISLYLSVADAADEDGASTGPSVLELAVTQPVLAAALAAVPENVASLVKTINTAGFSPASPDPSGIAYVGEELDRLVVGDGEVDETTGAGFHGVNVWLVDRVTGAASGAINTLTASPSNNEPVGAAYDPVADRLYLSKDGSSSRVWVYGRSGSTFTQIASFGVSGLGVGDAEGLAFGGDTLFIGDGSNKEVWSLPVGADRTFGTADDPPVTHFDTSALGVNDAEAIGYNTDTGNLWLASRREGEGILEVTPGGVPVSRAHYASGFDPLSPGGLEVAPSSADPSKLNLWIVDRGIDNNDQSSENDGKLYEVRIDAGEPPPPPPDPGSNALQNGGFETANGSSPSNWTTDPRFTQSNTDVHGGSFSGRHFATDDSGYTIEQTAAAVAGVQYQFSAWINAPTTSDAFKVVLKVQWRTNSKKISVVTLGRIRQHTNGVWTLISDPDLVSPAGTTRARVMMVVSSLNTSVYVDDFSLAISP